MALARNLSSLQRAVDGSAARALPDTQRTRRPEPRAAAPRRKKRPRRLLVAAGLSWACLVAFSLVVVHRNTLVLREMSRITELQEQLAKVEAQNQELEAKITEAVSVAEVERWARDHGMVRPESVQTLVGDPSAVAPRPAVAESREAPGTAEAKAGFWTSLQRYFARLRSGD